MMPSTKKNCARETGRMASQVTVYTQAPQHKSPTPITPPPPQLQGVPAQSTIKHNGVQEKNLIFGTTARSPAAHVLSVRRCVKHVSRRRERSRAAGGRSKEGAPKLLRLYRSPGPKTLCSCEAIKARTGERRGQQFSSSRRVYVNLLQKRRTAVATRYRPRPCSHHAGFV